MDEITPANNLKGFFVRKRTGEVAAVRVDQRFRPGDPGDRLEVVFIDGPSEIRLMKPADVEAIATTAELARTAPAKF